MRMLKLNTCGERSQRTKKHFLLNFDPMTPIAIVGMLLCLFTCIFPYEIFSQPIAVTATLDTNEILIGQQTKLTLNAEYRTDKGEIKVDFPKISDTLIKQIEVISKSPVERYAPDSSDLTRLAMKQTLVITSFDSGYYAIPPFRFVVNGDSTNAAETEALLLTVNTVAVDTTQNIKDIKPPIEVPFSWKEYLPYVYWGLGALLALIGIILLIVYLTRKQKVQPVPQIAVPKIPPHVTAFARLEKLREEKLWQQGKLKQYHSEISEILRQYIEHRYYIPAMEQVTDEIMHSMRTAEVSEEMKIKLRQTFILADLVKFAKEHPLPQENEQSWTNAYDFVNTTKVVIAEKLNHSAL